jgi:hypothetical protein
VIATMVNNRFFSEDISGQLTVQYFPQAGIRLLHVTHGNSGRYTVEVNLNNGGSLVTYEQSVDVQVTGKSVAQGLSVLYKVRSLLCLCFIYM